MIPLAADYCIGCGQILDKLEPADSRPSWIAGGVYRKMYGFRFTDLHLTEAVCPPCAQDLKARKDQNLVSLVARLSSGQKKLGLFLALETLAKK